MKIQWLCIHHSAVSYNKNADQWKANNNYHRKKWNFKSSLGFYLGYNYEISKAGIVRQARKDGERTAACYQNGMNDGRAIHIEIDGNFDIEMPTEAQKSSLRRLLLELVERYPQAKITYHRKWATYKSCPGKLIKDNWAKNLLKENMLKLIREKNRKEVYAVINNRNYYIGGSAFEDLLAEKLVSWELVKEVDRQINLDGILK